MWKYVSRRVRDTIERSANYFDKRSTTGLTTAPNNINEDNKKDSSPPCRWFINGKCWNTCKNDNNTNSKRWNFEHLNSSWLGAITWSSALALGYYASQLIHLKHRYHYKDEKKARSSIQTLLKSLHPYALCVNKNAPFLTSAPNVEKVIDDFTPTVHLISNDHSVGNDGQTHTASSGSSTTPLNSDNDLGDVLNSIENKLGLAAIENGQHQDGLNLLKSAANRNHAPALYNLGLCYELGLGVTADEKMAMDLYHSAALQEHPGAMYNLGIYYGQGRGGLTRDVETATRLLRLAALKGQEDAKIALKSLQIDSTPNVKSEQLNVQPFQYPYKSCAHHDIQMILSDYFVENVSSTRNMPCEEASVC